MTAADAASSTTETPKRKGWVDRNDTADETQDAAEVAAERTKNSVNSPKKVGGLREMKAPNSGKTESIEPLATEFKPRRSPLYDKSAKED